MRERGICASVLFATLAALIAMAIPASAAPDTRKVAVFEFELLDTSTQDRTRPPDAEHEKRLAMITHILREAIARENGYAVVDTAAANGERAQMPSLESCGDCALQLADKLGADLVATGFVHKISLLIIDMAVSIRDVKTGKLVAHAAVSIRGDTDESWQRGMRFLARDRLFRGEAD